ncbi:MAG: hypothetical protein ONB17_06185 [candidate division KSB1 bacterium]|nr:hypothetical protein [candidate division KSB1 bacterium]MDZ7378872.1 hypothetical protein [candidate division KSB1 bacterium]MDZ7385224.1 hypothetical protein [candidate division KSB1 bacterium]MDZ7392330.1 hypothetical protein [candidate division KSB1 bacterium]MDZ7412526.1 hypothetical protein [candidate division KSB1 bacterium]
MAEEKARGSILYQLLIVVLIAGLVGTLLYPKKLWKEEEQNTALCRQRMEHLLRAELLYISAFNTYTDSIPKLIEFVKGDPTGGRLQEYKTIDSLLAVDAINAIRDLGPKEELVSAVKAAVAKLPQDRELVDFLSLERLQQRYSKLPLEAMIGKWYVVPDSALVDTLRVPIAVAEVVSKGAPLVNNRDIVNILWFVATEHLDLEQPQRWVLQVLEHSPRLLAISDSVASATLATFALCPTSLESIRVAVIDTAVVKSVNISCPIDSQYIEKVKKDFLRFRIGGLRIENHGRIEGGERNWASKR